MESADPGGGGGGGDWPSGRWVSVLGQVLEEQVVKGGC